MLYEIRNRYSDAVIYSAEHPHLRAAVETAVAQNIRLDGASLDGASLDGASLDGASLVRASLVRASLVRASLVRARLDGARLTPIRDDLWAVLSASPAEVPSLIIALKEGRVDGSTYEGSCACLVGTLARERHIHYTDIPRLSPNASRPAERFFLCISRGDKPETNQFSKLALQWCEEWLGNMRRAFEPVALVV